MTPADYQALADSHWAKAERLRRLRDRTREGLMRAEMERQMHEARRQATFYGEMAGAQAGR